MFTGIIQNLGQIQDLEFNHQVLKYSVLCPEGFLAQVKLGASIAIDGTCQTLIDYQNNLAWFQAIPETLEKTTLGRAVKGTKVHLERSAKFGDEIGGHLLSGHIMGTAEIVDLAKPSPETAILRLKAEPALAKYLFAKGFVAIDGASLTLVEVKSSIFSVHLIPETLQRTHFGSKKIGDRVNIEIDAQTIATVRTVENWLASHANALEA